MMKMIIFVNMINSLNWLRRDIGMNRRMIEFNNLDRQYKKYADEYNRAAIRTLESGWYILGKELDGFEMEFADFCDVKYCVGLNSGLDALILAFRSLGVSEGDEVIVPANTYICLLYTSPSPRDGLL